MRKYAYVFDAIGRLDLAVIVPFGLGVLAGLMMFSRVLTWLLTRFYKPAMLTITGLLAGSMWVVWPFQERVYETVRGKARLVASSPVLPDSLDATVVVSVLWLLGGVAAVLFVQAWPPGGGSRAVPELPEVETTRRGIEPHLVGRRVST